MKYANIGPMGSEKTIGVLKLNTHFPRLPGDIGNPDSFRYRVVYQTVSSAIPSNVITANVLPESLQLEFCNATKQLLDQKASIITTTCGFLSSMQARLTSISTVPVLCSSLALLPLLESVHGGQNRLGVLTFNSETIKQIHLSGTKPGHIEGLITEDSLRRVITNDLTELNPAQAQREVIAAADRLLAAQPDTRAILLECTNLSPYKSALKQHTRVAIYDIVDALEWLLDSQPDLS